MNRGSRTAAAIVGGAAALILAVGCGNKNNSTDTSISTTEPSDSYSTSATMPTMTTSVEPGDTGAPGDTGMPGPSGSMAPGSGGGAIPGGPSGAYGPGGASGTVPGVGGGVMTP